MRRVILFAASVLMTSSCDGSTAIRDQSAHLFVVGTIVDAAGRPAVGIEVQLEARLDATCGSGSAITSASVVTDAAGKYTGQLSTFGFSVQVCVFARLLPVSGAGLRADSVSVPGAVMRSQNIETVRVDRQLLPSV